MKTAGSVLRFPERARRLKVISVHGAPEAGKSYFLKETLSRWRAGEAVVKVLQAPEDGGRKTCLSCALRGELKKAFRMAADQGARTLFLEVPCLWSPVELAEIFEDLVGSDMDGRLEPEFHAIVSVIDSQFFWRDLEHPETFFEQVWSAEALLEGIEFTDLIVLSRTTLLKEKDVAEIEKFIHSLQKRVEILRMGRDEDLLPGMLESKRFDYDETFRSAVVDKTPSWSYLRKRPFHPERLDTFFKGLPEDILRACGLLWVATREDPLRLNFIAPSSLWLDPEEKWLATADPFDIAYAFEQDPKIRETWDKKWGDRRNEIHFVGATLDTASLEAGLDACLLTDLEMKQDWSRFKDPLAPWIGEGSDLPPHELEE